MLEFLAWHASPAVATTKGTASITAVASCTVAAALAVASISANLSIARAAVAALKSVTTEAALSTVATRAEAESVSIDDNNALRISVTKTAIADRSEAVPVAETVAVSVASPAVASDETALDAKRRGVSRVGDSVGGGSLANDRGKFMGIVGAREAKLDSGAFNFLLLLLISVTDDLARHGAPDDAGVIGLGLLTADDLASDGASHEARFVFLATATAAATTALLLRLFLNNLFNGLSFNFFVTLAIAGLLTVALALAISAAVALTVTEAVTVLTTDGKAETLLPLTIDALTFTVAAEVVTLVAMAVAVAATGAIAALSARGNTVTTVATVTLETMEAMVALAVAAVAVLVALAAFTTATITVAFGAIALFPTADAAISVDVNTVVIAALRAVSLNSSAGLSLHLNGGLGLGGELSLDLCRLSVGQKGREANSSKHYERFKLLYIVKVKKAYDSLNTDLIYLTIIP